MWALAVLGVGRHASIARNEMAGVHEVAQLESRDAHGTDARSGAADAFIVPTLSARSERSYAG